MSWSTTVQGNVDHCEKIVRSAIIASVVQYTQDIDAVEQAIGVADATCALIRTQAKAFVAKAGTLAENQCTINVYSYGHVDVYGGLGSYGLTVTQV